MAVFSLRRFLREQWSTLPSPSAAAVDVSSKTFMVTGSNVGLGLEASVHLAKMGPKLLVATSRDSVKCEQTRECILERAAAGGVASPGVTAWPLDLNSFENVRAFVDRFAAEGNGVLNALVANAGVFCPDYAQTSDGWEVMLQVNYLSTALLSILLLPYLVNASTAGSIPRLVVVSSLGHYLASSSLKTSETWTDILETINSQEFSSRSVSSLLDVVFVRELAARFADPIPIVACAVDPGYCRSSLFRALENKWYIGWVFSLTRNILFARSAKEGSKTLVHAVVGGEGRAMHGRYLSSCRVAEESDFVFTPEGKAFSAKLWDETITVLSRVDKRVPEIVAKYLRADA
ncbi:short-chain dehydrogenase [Lanmaoa asiatica]|nr:short-chain dehydrogenase [Lanmaoa asiatica]